MDPLSTAGLGLAVVGLAGQCFSGAMKALDLIATARGLHKEYKYLTLRLRLEQQRCYNWAAACGLLAFLNGDEEALDENMLGLNRTKILEVVVEIETLVMRFIKQKGKYESLVPDNDSEMDVHESDRTYPAIDYAATASADNLMPNLRQLWSNTRRSVTAMELPKRVRWAVMDRDKYESLINRLRELNDALLDLVDNNLNRAIHETTHETKLSVLQLHNKVDDLDQLIKALLPNVAFDRRSSYTLPSPRMRRMEALSPSSPTNSHFFPRHGTRERQAEDDLFVAGLAHFKASNSIVEEESQKDETMAQDLESRPATYRSRGIKLSRAHIRLDASPTTKSRRHRSSGTYYPPGKPAASVWIEWKPYKPVDQRLRPSFLISDRVQKLAILLADPDKPQSLRVPTCLGYFDDGEVSESAEQVNSDDEDDRPPEWRFGLVFAKSESESIISLHDLLTRAPQPSLTRRISLAVAIASSILSLHAVNWLHKGLRSSNIVFMVPANDTGSSNPTSTRRIDFGSPLLAGFDYARPDVTGEQTEHPTIRPDHVLYRHPDSHGVEIEAGEQFVKTFDIYSLGVVLTEIALWQPATSFLRTKPPSTMTGSFSKPTSYKDNRDKLLHDETIQELLEGSTGSKYIVAVQSCLEGKNALGLSVDEDETNEIVGMKLQRGFHRQVLRKLEAIQT